MSFLTAEWRKLALANYAIDPEVLSPYLPWGTELDFWDGKCFVSLVGFMFLNTRLLGVKVPFHVNFEEVNLRFYVRRNDASGWRRGVVFIKEIVPKAALALVANTVYGEHYETLPMRHRWAEETAGRTVAYHWKKGGAWHGLTLRADREARAIEPGSQTEFITEHYWGYARLGPTRTNEYEVTHPKWQVYPVRSHRIDVNFGSVYGHAFSFLNDLEPESVMLAEGSKITVESRKSIKRS